MARIRLEDIIEELSQDGWKVLSDTYKNLDTEMAFECSEGHSVYSTWKDKAKRVSHLRTKCF